MNLFMTLRCAHNQPITLPAPPRLHPRMMVRDVMEEGPGVLGVAIQTRIDGFETLIRHSTRFDVLDVKQPADVVLDYYHETLRGIVKAVGAYENELWC